MRGFLFMALVSFACGSAGEADNDRAAPRAGTSGAPSTTAGEPAGGASSGAPAMAGGGASAGTGKGGAASGGGGMQAAAGTPSTGGGGAGSGGGPTAGDSSGGKPPADPPSADCPGVSSCEYRPAFNVCDCEVSASYCDEPITARCWKYNVKPYVTGFQEPKSPLCSLGYSDGCAAADAALDAYCCQ